MIKALLLVGAGGFAGACARYIVARWCSILHFCNFPFGTFLVNILGCFLIGLLTGLIEKTGALSPERSLLLITGFCGSFTTFSTFASEIFGMGNRGEWLSAFTYMALSIIIGLMLVYAGRTLVR